MNPKLMQEALGRRKAAGLDITILLAPHDATESGELVADEEAGVLPGDESQAEDEEEAKELDMAPDATELGQADEQKAMALGKMGHHENMVPGEELINHPDAAQDRALFAEEMSKMPMGRGSLLQRAKKVK